MVDLVESGKKKIKRRRARRKAMSSRTPTIPRGNQVTGLVWVQTGNIGKRHCNKTAKKQADDATDP